MKLRIKKGDIVKVISGNDKGATGRVLELYPDKMRILVEGINVRKKHSRPTPKNQKGGILSKEMPVHYSNVMIMDSEKNPTRISIRFDTAAGKRIPIRTARTNGNDL